MVDKKKVISKLEDIIYSSEDKYQSDILLTNFISVINYLELADFKLNIENSDLIRLIIRHKAFKKNCQIWIKDGQLFLNFEKIDLDQINKKIQAYFELDKKNKKE